MIDGVQLHNRQGLASRIAAEPVGCRSVCLFARRPRGDVMNQRMAHAKLSVWARDPVATEVQGQQSQAREIIGERHGSVVRWSRWRSNWPSLRPRALMSSRARCRSGDKNLTGPTEGYSSDTSLMFSKGRSDVKVPSWMSHAWVIMRMMLRKRLCEDPRPPMVHGTHVTVVSV